MLLVLVVIGAILFAAREGRLRTVRASEEARPETSATLVSPAATPPASQSGSVAPWGASSETKPAGPAFSGAGNGTFHRDLSTAAFRALVDHTLRELPHRSDLKRLKPSQLHEAPPPIRAAAVHLGRIGDVLQQNPALKAEGLEFYQKCSLDAEGLTAVRALCLNRALRLYAELHRALWDLNGQKVPPRVLALAKRL